MPPDPETVSSPDELLEAIEAEADQLEALEFFISDLQRHPLGPAAAAEVARVLGLLLTLQAAADGLQRLDLEQ